MAPNLPGFVDLPIRAELSDRLGVEVTIENDVNLATVGEANEMAGKGTKHFAAISIGTGIGMGMVMGRRSVPGRTWGGGRDRFGQVAAGGRGGVSRPHPGGRGFGARNQKAVSPFGGRRGGVPGWKETPTFRPYSPPRREATRRPPPPSISRLTRLPSPPLISAG